MSRRHVAILLCSHIRGLEMRRGGPKTRSEGERREEAEGGDEERRGTEKKEPGQRTGESQKQRYISGTGCSSALLASTWSPERRLCQTSLSHYVHMREERACVTLGSTPREAGLDRDAQAGREAQQSTA